MDIGSEINIILFNLRTTLLYLDIDFEAWLFLNRFQIWLTDDLVQNKKIQVRGGFPYFFQINYERAYACWRINPSTNLLYVFFVLIWNHVAYKNIRENVCDARLLCWKVWGIFSETFWWDNWLGGPRAARVSVIVPHWLGWCVCDYWLIFNEHQLEEN